MPAKIRVLNDTIINQIAAGEVIENGSSVVKELVENSLDAGATEIVVEIKGGGRTLIHVSDNGCGMSKDDAILCFERHATSKISSFDDLYQLHTMGFRGEAVPSIASISKFTLVTSDSKDPQNPSATMVIAEGGKIIQCSPSVRTQGTSIEIKSLFFNVPVRKKFQKAPSYDVTDIHKVISAFALGYPHISFELISDSKVILKTTGQGHSGDQMLHKERLQDILGAEFAAASLPIAIDHPEYQLTGYIGKPSYHRSNRFGQHLFINRRHVQSPLIASATREGYGTALPANRFPCFVLHFTIPGALVDVNVHPQKKEVRLCQGHVVKELIHQAVRQTLIGESQQREIAPAAISLPSILPWEVEPTASSVTSQQQPAPSLPPISFPQYPSLSTPAFLRPQPLPAQQQVMEPVLRSSHSFQPPQILAVLSRYILVDASSIHKAGEEVVQDGFYIVDQHVAHFRIIYERFARCMSSSSPHEEDHEAQLLLIPHTIELSAMESSLVIQYIKELRSVGIGIQEFGPHTFIIDAVPQNFPKEDIEAIVKGLVSELQECDHERIPAHEREKRLVFAASRAMMTKKARLTIDSAQHLVNRLMRCQQPYQCPLGKPTMIRMTAQDLDKQFF